MEERTEWDVEEDEDEDERQGNEMVVQLKLLYMLLSASSLVSRCFPSFLGCWREEGGAAGS